MVKNFREKYRAPKTKMPEQIGTKWCPDATSQRTGWILEDEVTKTILTACSDAKECISSKKVFKNKLINSTRLTLNKKLISMNYLNT
jgi:hypothetical protein